MDQEDAELCSSEHRRVSREVIRAALNGMTMAQLSDLKSTALRFRHLPFPRLVEALFMQQAERDAATTHDPESSKAHEHDFSDGCIRDSESTFVRELLEEIERTLECKRATSGE